MSDFLSAKAAAELLGITRATLYSYASRGFIRTRPGPNRRAREYHAGDVQERLQHKSARRDPQGMAQRTLRVSGLPVLCSALTLIDSGRVYYRGQEVVRLSRTTPFEAVAGLLWGKGDAGEAAGFTPRAGGASARGKTFVPAAVERRALGKMRFITAAQRYLGLAEEAEPMAYRFDTDGLRWSGARILRGLCGVATGDFDAQGPVAESLSRALGLGQERAKALNAALVLCADHELNVSAFTARVIASAGATLHAAISGALGALSGHKHGGHAASVARLLDEAGAPHGVLSAAVRRGRELPGFGHPLYPDGDPRAKELLALAARFAPGSRALKFVGAARACGLPPPSLDLGLVALVRALKVPDAMALKLFALGRVAGWVGHCLEQYREDELIRPRAKYVGLLPPDRQS